MIKNSQLRESLQSLTQIIYPFYENGLRLDDRFEDDKQYVAIMLTMLDEQIAKIPEFDLCCKIMAKDEKIKKQLGQLVGTRSNYSLVADEKTCVLGFLKQLYLESNQYDQSVFDKKYLSFEDFFYSDHLVYKDSANLYNFSFADSELALGHGITIRRSIARFLQQTDYEKYIERMYKPYTAFSNSMFVIERDYKAKKIVGEPKETEQNAIFNEQNKSPVLFDLVIDSLRILKPSAVYRDHRIKSKSVTFQPHGGVTERFPFYENIAVGGKCNIEVDEIATLRKVFNFLCGEENSRLLVAKRRLSSGIERRSPEDRLIDYMIGLEALYLPDGNAELSFRLSLRVAFLLSSGEARKETFEFLRKMYGMRSKIVHGSKYELSEEDVKKLEQLLRESILLWIEDKSNFSVTQKTKSGRVKTEGKLDTIFFQD